MPRPNPQRSIAGEESLSRRIAYERDRLGMSYDELASRMTDIGCPIQSSAIWKIENADRRITVDELIALSRVFKIPMAKLVVSPEVAASKEAMAAAKEIDGAVDQLLDLAKRLADAYTRMNQAVEAGANQAIGTEQWSELLGHLAERTEAALAALRGGQ